MKLIQVSAVVSIFGLIGCKTSEFRGNVAATETVDANPSQPKPSPAPTPIEAPVISRPVDASTTELQLNQSCEKPAQLLLSQVKLSFPTRKKCQFNVEPNKAPVEAQLQAREVTTAMLKLPENSEICSMTMESPANAKMKYDDFIILTLDDFVIFSSNKDFLPKLDRLGTLYKWDFLKLRETPVKFDAQPYCIGAMERCNFPRTDTEGPVLLKLNYSEIAGVTKAIQGKTQVPIDLIATGDNDDDPNSKLDCYHETLDLTVSMNYIKKPK